MSRALFFSLSLAALAALGGCATPSRGPGASGAATASLAPDGSIQLRTRKPGLFGGHEVVVFRPGEPGYAAMKAQLEAVQSSPARRPVLTWTVGQPY